MSTASSDIPAFVAGKTLPKSFHACPNREAALLSLCHAKPADVDRLLSFTPAEWRKLLPWLDASGLSLYLAHQLDELNLREALPDVVKQRMQQDLADNQARTQGLLRESVEIQTEFKRANICYAVLRGFSLCLSSVSAPGLRHQLNVEYLVDEGSASKARELLEQAGYRLCGINDRTWEFKKNETKRFSAKNMYKDGFGQIIELHIDAEVPGRESALSRREYREIEGMLMPVLAPADQFLMQGMHVFQNVCSSFLRTSHLLEFYRHMSARSNDPAFWSDVRSLAEGDPRTVLGLGVVLNLIESVMDGEIPAKLVTWTMLRLPEPAQCWVSMYGPHCVYGTPPGTKLYRLLQREMESAGVSLARPAGEAIQATPFLRLRFHVVEGLRYAWASYRWGRFRNELSA